MAVEIRDLARVVEEWHKGGAQVKTKSDLEGVCNQMIRS